MRVLDCDTCGETLTAANDAELAAQVAAHHRDRHGDDLGEDRVQELVRAQAYDAMDT